jgi:hypothetical protein
MSLDYIKTLFNSGKKLNKERAESFPLELGAPINPEQAMLLLCAYIYYNDNFSRVWTIDFFQFLVLINDELRSCPEAYSLVKLLKKIDNGTDESLYMWKRVAKKKYEERLINKIPPYQFNDNGLNVCRKILEQEWGDDFKPEVKRTFTPDLIARLKKLGKEYSQHTKLGINKLYTERFLPDEIEFDEFPQRRSHERQTVYSLRSKYT